MSDNNARAVEGEVLPPLSYSAQRLAIHEREAVLSPADFGFSETPYPTLVRIEGPLTDDKLTEVIYTFKGPFWNVFRDVFNMACQRVHINNRKKGFWPDDTDERGRLRLALYRDTHGRNVGEALALMDSENGEALDAYRSGGLDQKDDKLPHRSGLFTEINDTVIRAMDFLGGMMADAGTIIVEKLTYNKDQRGHLHGRRF